MRPIMIAAEAEANRAEEALGGVLKAEQLAERIDCALHEASEVGHALHGRLEDQEQVFEELLGVLDPIDEVVPLSFEFSRPLSKSSIA